MRPDIRYEIILLVTDDWAHRLLMPKIELAQDAIRLAEMLVNSGVALANAYGIQVRLMDRTASPSPAPPGSPEPPPPPM